MTNKDLTSDSLAELKQSGFFDEQSAAVLENYLHANFLMITYKPACIKDSLLDQVAAICSAHNKKITS